MTALEQKLAAALAEAVKYESEKFDEHKRPERLPGWYQPAVKALEEYDDQRLLVTINY
jgi:hypothetical protein